MLIGLAMITNVVLNYLLIPKYQILGACIATVGAEALTTLLAFVASRKFLQIPRFTGRLLKSFLAWIIIIAFIYYFQFLNFFIISIITSLLYLFIIISFKLISDDDRQYYINLIKEKISPKNNNAHR
jgi:O-antigen/teichoic acid export membrane protein